MISVLLVDDHPVVIEGLRKVLATAGEHPLLAVRTVGSGRTLVTEPSRSHDIDTVEGTVTAAYGADGDFAT